MFANNKPTDNWWDSETENVSEHMNIQQMLQLFIS